MSIAMLPTPPVAPVTTIGPARRRLPVALHAMDRERRGESRGAERHGAERIEPGGIGITLSALTRATSA